MRGGARICAGFGLHNSDMQTALDARRIFRYHEPNDEVMTMQFLCAPMEGVTGDLFRQAQRQTFPAADSYYTPFLSPTANRTFSPRELREIDPAHNAGIHVVPQLMGHCAEDFLWMAGQLADMGYDEVNFNLGCPSNTVTAKKKGAGQNLKMRIPKRTGSSCPRKTCFLLRKKNMNRLPMWRQSGRWEGIRAHGRKLQTV